MMFNTLLESREKAWADTGELKRLNNKYGSDMIDILHERANDQALDMRSRRHWNRLLRKAKRL